MALLALIPLLLLAWGTVRLASNALQRQAELRVTERGTAVAKAVELEFNGLADIVDTYRNKQEFRKILRPGAEVDTEAAQSVLNQVLRSRKGIDLAFLADPNGIVLMFAPENPTAIGADFSHEGWYQGVSQTDELFVSGVYRASAMGQPPVIVAAARIRANSDPDSPVEGIFAVGYDLDTVENLVTEMALGGVRLTVVDRSGYIVARPGHQPDKPYSHHESTPVAARHSAYGTVKQYANSRNENLLGVKIPVGKMGWTVIAEMEAGAALAPMDGIKAAVAGITVLVWILLGASIKVVNSSQQRRLKVEGELLSSQRAREMKEAELGLVLPASGLGSAVYNIKARTFSCSERFESLHGLRPGTLSKDPWQIYAHVHPDDLAALKSGIKDALDDKRQFDFEYRIVDPQDESVRWLHSHGNLKKDSKGNNRYAVGVVSDVTERLNALEATRSAQAFLDSVIENIPDMVFVKDAESLKFVRLNRAGEALLGFSRLELIGKGDADFFPKEQADFFIEKDREVLKNGVMIEIEAENLRTRYGAERILHTKKIPIMGNNGNPEFLLGISRDITEQRLTEAHLQAAKAEADRVSKAKSEFLSRMSHELRTPLNAVLGFGQLLEMSELAESQRDYASHIIRAGQHLLNLINEVLDVSRIETGALSLSFQPVNVADVIAETVNLVRPLAAQRNISLSNEVADDADLFVVADRQRLAQVLLNLLGNAIKYNLEGGSVVVFCESRAGNLLRIVVRDTGPGISPEQQKRLFVPFERLAASMTKVEGTGLGLALARGLCEAMQGSIGVESEVGKGSSFWVELNSCEPASRGGGDGS